MTPIYIDLPEDELILPTETADSVRSQRSGDRELTIGLLIAPRIPLVCQRSMPEEEHEKGRAGVLRAKRLLDGTMRFRMSYDAYTGKGRVVLPMLVDGQSKRYDLCGTCFDDDDIEGPGLYVESKDQKDAGSQSSQFTEFLSQAYSATLRARELHGSDPEHNFMWATTCPWKGSGFREVAKRDALLEAIEGAGPQILPPDHEVDRDAVDAVVSRLWVWVISDRQEHMILGKMMRTYVAAKREEAR